jgi:hypothetical protein
MFLNSSFIIKSLLLSLLAEAVALTSKAHLLDIIQTAIYLTASSVFFYFQKPMQYLINRPALISESNG